ncbi:hypothetical protein QVD17_20318 [Tagetes erecta]|uniref:NAD(P)-binding domain-containing protein n=1 Tax=Tagetes erecta TaxID=13708 RepID=A0AAD8KPQ5_TARER|nr:hypothetical protein QVD17_20318 [Tagetes erecta]
MANWQQRSTFVDRRSFWCYWRVFSDHLLLLSVWFLSYAVAFKQVVSELAGEHAANLIFHKMDIRDKAELEKLFASTKFDAVIHFAGLKAVGESVQKPLMYYDNNVVGTLTLLEVMAAHGCKKIVFSSSATVYGWPKVVPCTEDFPLSAANPYGRTKLMIEDIFRDIYASDSGWKMIMLRYFNPVGAHPSGYIGEDSLGIPNNLMPFVQQVAVGRLPALKIFRTDYSTKDGTGVQDYIHVSDLANGHMAALKKLSDPEIGCEVYNLGTGRGTSVLEMVAAFEKASRKEIPLVIAGRRPGDAEVVYASTAKSERELNWKLEKAKMNTRMRILIEFGKNVLVLEQLLFLVFVSKLKCDAAIKPDAWAHPWTTYERLNYSHGDIQSKKKGRCSTINMWYFPHDCNSENGALMNILED